MRSVLGLVVLALTSSLDFVTAGPCKPNTLLSSNSESTSATSDSSSTSTDSVSNTETTLSSTLDSTDTDSSLSRTSDSTSSDSLLTTGTSSSSISASTGSGSLSTTSDSLADTSITVSSSTSDLLSTTSTWVSSSSTETDDTTTASGTATETTSSSTSTAAARTVENLLVNGNFPNHDPDSPGGIYAFEIENQASQKPASGYTGDGAGETGCVDLVVSPKDTGAPVPKKRQADDAASIQQWLEVPSTSNKMTLRLYFVVMSVEQPETCRLEVYYGSDLFASSPYFAVPVSGDWEELVHQGTIQTNAAYLKLQLKCINGGAADVFVDQIFVSDQVSPLDLSDIAITWPSSAKDLSTTSSGVSSTATYSTTSLTTSTISTVSSSSSISTTSWTITVSGTAIPSSTTIPSSAPALPTSLDDMSAGAREIYDYLVAHMHVDENGNVDVPAPEQEELTVSAYNPEDTARQAELEDALQALGLKPVDDLFAAADAKVTEASSTTCPNVKRGVPPLKKTVTRSRVTSRFMDAAGRFENLLNKRGDDGFWDYACGDVVEALAGLSEATEAGQQLLCAGKSLYDSRDALKCIFGGCGNVVSYTELTYTWNYEWIVKFPSISQWLQMLNDNNVLSCVDCSFKISSLKFSGKIVVWSTQGTIQIKEATLIPEVTGSANMIVDLKTDRAWTSKWNYIFEAAPLDTIKHNDAYSITSKILYDVGIKFSAEKAVNVQGGASFSLNNAKAELNMASNTPTVRSKSNWEPSVSYILPSFKTSGGVTIQPYFRWGIQFSVNIYNQVTISPAITSQSMATIKSTFSFDATTACPAPNKLAVSTFLTTNSNMLLRSGVYEALYNGDSRAVNQCFDVPDLVPSPDEIKALGSSGGEFCTSFLAYTPPKSTMFDTATTYTPSTTIIHRETTVIPITTTKTTTTTPYIESTDHAEVPFTTYTVTGAGTASFPLLNLKRDIATTAAPGELIARAVPTPSALVNWDRTKISFACRQVATGTSTVTQTVTTAVPSGAASTTITVTENPDGPLVTRTIVENWIKYKGAVGEPTQYPYYAEPTATACAEPAPETGKCFKIKVHGPDWVDGQYMKYWDNGGFVAANGLTGALYDTFYLASSGKLVMQDQRAGATLVLFAGSLFSQPGSSPWALPNVIWGGESSRDLTNHERFYCSKDADPCSRALHCNTETMDGISFLPPAYYSRDYDAWYLHFRPLVGAVQGSVPASFTWEEASCICGGDSGWTTKDGWYYDEESGGLVYGG
ncbi:hypothetical protein AK830_g2321 [Neonectria ditissima]|uniref:CBM-cenC domain-containing protein n=1 Tax=Neonectria ditissima TaxID=78410 RepID=A0A0P7BBE9_9HYPO|nr:hypothetical protein AK830_g2321 [Neonectria ditissima]